MTRVSFFKKGDLFTGFRAEGHIGYAPAGSDIVCAGVSALLQNAVIALATLAIGETENRKKTGLLFAGCRRH